MRSMVEGKTRAGQGHADSKNRGTRDGMAHDMGSGPARDERRDRWLAEQGVETLRVPAADVLKNMDEVMDAILTRCRLRSP